MSLRPYSDFFLKFNRFGDMKEVAREVLETDRDKNIARFALSSLVLSYRYEEEDKNPWDERNKASKIYSYNNKDRFREIFLKYSGLDAPITEPGCAYYSKAICYKAWHNTEWWDWIEAVQTEHPTVIQSYYRGMAAVLEEELGILYPGFPMI